MVAPTRCVHHASRQQRGTDFFHKLFTDLLAVADVLSKEDNKKHPLIFFDFTAWGGDSVAACWPQFRCGVVAGVIVSIAVLCSRLFSAGIFQWC